MAGAIRKVCRVVKVSALGAAPFDVTGLHRPLRSSCCCCCRAALGGPLHGPSVLHAERLDAVAHVVLEFRVSHRHAFLAPLQPPFVDGLHRTQRPAGQVPAIKDMAGSEGGAAADGWTPVRETEQSSEETVPVELGLGPLWDVAFREFGPVVG